MTTRNQVRAIVFALASTLTATAPVVAQQDSESSSGPEVGVLAGFTRAGGQNTIAVPGGFPGVGGPVYIALPVGDRWSIRAEMNLLSVNDPQATVFGLGGYGTMSLGGARRGPYVLGGGGLLFASGGGSSETEFSVGGGLGYLFSVGSAAVVRLETRYHRFVESGGNTIQVFSGFGVRIG